MIRVGTAGWSYKDWQGIVYPPQRPRGFDELTYLSRYFSMLEINVTFYRPVPASTSQNWLKKIEHNQDFRFTAKLLRVFTHERNGTREDEQQFKDGLAPLLEAGRLGAVLMQFPSSFHCTDKNQSYISHLRSRFAEFPLVLEVRHASWAVPRVLDWLADIEVALCNIDQPRFKTCIKPSAEVTWPKVAYVRLHGNRWENWFRKNAQSHERYDYLYSIGELEPWAHRIEKVAKEAEDTYAVTNNHYHGKSAANALELAALLKQKVSAPEPLMQHYHELREVC